MLDCALIEVRQHLCCANVFLKFKPSLNDSESLKINVDEKKVQLQNPTISAEILVNNYFTILAGTFSNLIVDADNASFRISIKEVQLTEHFENWSKNIIKLNLKEEDEEAAVLCGNCEAILVAQQKYEKIREFPSGAIDVSEFFCHHGPSFKDVLVPNMRDLFYGFQFVVLNASNIEKNTKNKENHVYCKRCLAYLGEALFNGKAVKLWSDSICFGLRERVFEIFTSEQHTSPLHTLMLKAIEETSLPSPEPLLRHMHFTKVLLEASFPNRQQQYLLLHILEKHLPVLRNKADIILKEECQNTHIELEVNKAFKLLYRLIAKDDNDDNNHNDATTNWPPLLLYWQQNINILKMKISPFLFRSLSDELNRNISILPQVYRVNNDDFLLSYIFY